MELHDPSEHQSVVVNVISLHCLSLCWHGNVFEKVKQEQVIALGRLLASLDKAIDSATIDEVYVDEVNTPQN